MQGRSIARSVLLVAAALFVLGLVLGIVAFLQGPPTPEPTEKSLHQPLATSPEETPSGEALTTPLDVVIELEAGEFSIVPAEMGKTIVVHAEYDESLYRLEQDFTPAGKSGGRFWLRYGSRGAWRQLRRGLFALRQALGSDETEEPEHTRSRLQIELPAHLPMRLELHLEKGEAKVDLTGLSLVGLVVHHAMGELELRIDAPNPIPMDELVLHSKMGEARVFGLGNAAATVMEFRGRMGNFELDFDGAWKSDVDASVQVTMGEALLRIPREVYLDASNRHVLFGSLESSRHDAAPDVEDPHPSPHLRLETAAQFGSLTIR